MPNSPISPATGHPAWVWGGLMIAIFVAEYAIMLALPWVIPGEQSHLVEAAIDAILLTLIVGPILWWFVVSPIRDVLQIRTRYLAELFNTIEAERRRIAHDLHDGVGQSLSLLVSGLRSTQDGTGQEDVLRRCQQLQAIAENALRETKALALGLRPSMLDDLGLVPALGKIIADLRDHYPIDISFEQEDQVHERLPEEFETAVFRIVQEALTNLLKHSGATKARIHAHLGKDNVLVTVWDNGRGIEPKYLEGKRPGHLGLRGMIERALLVGGKLEIESSAGQGTTVKLLIPREE